MGKYIEYPFDTVKVRLQSQPDHLPLQYKGPLDCFRQSIRADGFLGLYRGISAPLVGAALENSSLFFWERLGRAAIYASGYSPQDQPLPVMFVHGTKDPVTPYAGGMAKMFRVSPRGLGLSAQDTAAYYARRNGITAAATTTPVTAASAGPTWVERTDFRQQDHQPVTLYTVHEGGHSIPGPKSARPRVLMGRTDHTFDTPQAISEFFGLTTGRPQA